MRIGIIGCGHMGSALARGILRGNLGKLWIGNPHKIKLNVCPSEGKKYHWTPDNCEVVSTTDVIIISVKPNVVMQALEEIKKSLKPNQILISVAAGISLEKLTKWSGGHKKIARIIPNLAAQVFASVSVWKAKNGLTKKEKLIVTNLLESFGVAIEVPNEELINKVTVVSGSGPAYVAAFLECMAKKTEEFGFSKKEARAVALETVKGSLVYMEKTGIEFGKLAEAVQTKGGITEAGFKVLKKKRWQKTLEKAFEAGYKKAREIAR